MVFRLRHRTRGIMICSIISVLCSFPNLHNTNVAPWRLGRSPRSSEFHAFPINARRDEDLPCLQMCCLPSAGCALHPLRRLQNSRAFAWPSGRLPLFRSSNTLGTVAPRFFSSSSPSPRRTELFHTKKSAVCRPQSTFSPALGIHLSVSLLGYMETGRDRRVKALENGMKCLMRTPDPMGPQIVSPGDEKSRFFPRLVRSRVAVNRRMGRDRGSGTGEVPSPHCAGEKEPSKRPANCAAGCRCVNTHAHSPFQPGPGASAGKPSRSNQWLWCPSSRGA